MQALGYYLLFVVVLTDRCCECGRSSSVYDEAEDILLFTALNGTNGIEDGFEEGSDGMGTETYNASTAEPVGVDRDDRSIKFLLYAREYIGIDNGTQIYIGNASHLLESGFIPDAPTKIICHGYMSSYRRGPGKMLIPAYFEARQGRPLNIISINWSGMSGLFRSYMKRIYHGLYFPPARNTELVGNATGAMIEFLVNELGMDFDNFHLIGHSLGAHVMGYAGRYLKTRFGRSVARITALDPAGPCFETFRRACFRGKFQPVSRNDADFVDAIHTHAWALGMKKPVGHVDFYPNGGYSQPGCFKLSWGALFKSVSGICSHKRAIELMRESILNYGHEIRAHPCHDLNAASKGSCPFHAEDYALLGEPCSRLSKGIYFVKTKSKPPYISLNRNVTRFKFRF